MAKLTTYQGKLLKKGSNLIVLSNTPLEPDKVFYTKIGTPTATKIQNTGAENIENWELVTNYGVRIRPVGDEFWIDGKTVIDSLIGDSFTFSEIPVSDLIPETTYEYQAWVNDGNTTTYADTKSITTLTSGGTEPSTDDPFLTTTPSETEWEIDKTPSAYTFDINSNVQWRAEIDDAVTPWIHFSEIIEEGGSNLIVEDSGNRTLHIVADENNTMMIRNINLYIYPINESTLNPITITIFQSISEGSTGGGGGSAVALTKNEMESGGI